MKMSQRRSGKSLMSLKLIFSSFLVSFLLRIFSALQSNNPRTTAHTRDTRQYIKPTVWTHNRGIEDASSHFL